MVWVNKLAAEGLGREAHGAVGSVNVRYGSWLRENVEVQRTHRRRFLRTAIEVKKIRKRDQFPLI
jgi:hypothetical protein